MSDLSKSSTNTLIYVMIPGNYPITLWTPS